MPSFPRMNGKPKRREPWREDQQGNRAGGAGRHTLGSDHDSLQPPAPGQSAEDVAQMAAAHRESITHPVWWRSACERARGIEGEFGRVLRQLFEHVEFGWQPVATLLIAGEALVDSRSVDARVVTLAEFAVRDVAGEFRRCALAASALAPTTAGAVTGAPQGEGAADSFDRYLKMLHLAAADEAIPAELADTIRTVAEALADWAAEFAVLGAAAVAERPTQAGDGS